MGMHLMLESDPNIPEIRHILEHAYANGFEPARYFLLLLDSSTREGCCLERTVSTFKGFFESRKLWEY